MPIIAFQPGSEDVEGIHIETQMENRTMQEHRGEKAPIFPLQDEFIYFHPHAGNQIESEQSLACGLQNKDKNVDHQKRVADVRSANWCADRYPLDGRWGLWRHFLRIFRIGGRSGIFSI